MKSIVALFLTVALVSSAWSQSFKSAHVAADAQWVVHAHVVDMFKTRFGERLAQQMEEGDANHQLAAFRAMFQLDPKKDIASVTLYGQSETPETGVAIVKGQFNRDHISTILKAMKGYREHRHNDTVVHQWLVDQDAQTETQPSDDASNQVYGTFHGGNVMVLSGTLAPVKSALDVLNKTKPALSNPDLLRVLNQTAPGVYLQATANLSAMQGAAPAQPAQGPDFKKEIKTLNLTVGETLDTLHLKLELGAVSAEAAAQMHAMAQGFLAMMQMQQADNPDMAKLMQALSFSLDGSTIRVGLKMPVADAIEAMEKQQRAGAGVQAR